MELYLKRSDLKPEYKDIGFQHAISIHFSPQVRQAIKIVGYGLFQEYGRPEIQYIYPPRKAAKAP